MSGGSNNALPLTEIPQDEKCNGRQLQFFSEQKALITVPVNYPPSNIILACHFLLLCDTVQSFRTRVTLTNRTAIACEIQLNDIFQSFFIICYENIIMYLIILLVALKQQFLYRNREIDTGFGLSLLSGFRIDRRFRLNSVRLPVQCGFPTFADAGGIRIPILAFRYPLFHLLTLFPAFPDGIFLFCLRFFSKGFWGWR